MKENARQGFWNGALPPIGYRITAGEQRGHRIKKTLEIDPFQAETVRLIFRLTWEGDDTSEAMGVKSITKHLNGAGIRTRDGGRWGIDAVHKVLTRMTYIGRHRFNTKFWKTRERSRRRKSSRWRSHLSSRWPSSRLCRRCSSPGAQR
jgi:hypothetical protein